MTYPLNLLVENPNYDIGVVLEEDTNSGKKQMYFEGIYMRANIKNKNNRIYSLDEMIKEVNRYNEDMIKTGRSLGELNHPSCLTKSAKILTDTGLKSIVDINVGDLVYTINTTNNTTELNMVDEKIDEPYNGLMYNIKYKDIDTTVTPNHRFVLRKKDNTYSYVTAKELYDDNNNTYSHDYIPTNIAKTVGVYLDKRLISIKEITNYNDNVYCIKTKNSNFYCIDNGKGYWSGNSIDVNPERSCHIITEIKQDGNNFYGKSKILNTPMGQIVKSLMMDGVKLGVSSRALGKLEESGDHKTVSDFRFICADVVHDPSVDTAFVDGIYESKQYILKCDGTICEFVENTYDNLNKSLCNLPKNTTAKNEKIKTAIIQFINDMRNI